VGVRLLFRLSLLSSRSLSSNLLVGVRAITSRLGVKGSLTRQSRYTSSYLLISLTVFLSRII
jgi:hypothetical protein